MSGRRRFVHVFATFGAGGPQVRAAQLIGHLGRDVEHVVMAMDGNTDARAMLPAGSAVEFVDPPTARGFLAMRRTQIEWLRQQRPDLVLTYNWGAIESVAATRRARLPLVHHEDGFGPEEARQRLRRRSWMRRWLLRRVPVIVPSAVLRGIARTEWRLRDGDVHHLVNGVDLDRFAPAKPLVGAAAGEAVVIGTVGGLRAEKDHHNLLRAVAQLPATVRVCLVGSGGLEQSLRDQAMQLGIGDRVEFAGQTDDTAPWYRRFSLFVLSSRTEQMPIALLEAMASGLPVVATDVGDVRAILPPAAVNCIAPREDAEALARAMRPLIDGAALRAELGAANRSVAVDNYASTRCLDRFCAVYDAAAARR